MSINDSRIKIGLVGYGYWGPNLARNVWQADHAELAVVAETDPSQRAAVHNTYGGAVEVVEDYRDALESRRLDALIIATPLSTHEEIASEGLDAGCHVLVEKPIAASSAAASRLIEKADSRGLVLMVDHTFIYSRPVEYIRDSVQSGELGEIHYFDSVRVNLGLFQHDTNVLWDLAVHDVSIMKYVLTERPVAVSATGIKNIAGQLENVAYLTVFFENDRTIGHVHVNWLAPVKMRQTVVCGSRKMVVWDDLQQAEPVKIYDKGIELQSSPAKHEVLVDYRTGDAVVPHIGLREPLRACVDDFIDSIASSRKPRTDGEFGLEVLKVIEAAEQSMRQRGAPAAVDP